MARRGKPNLVRCIFAAAMTLCGCDRSAPAPVARPTTAATAPASSALAATAPAVSVININGHSDIFPAARLRLEQEDGRIVALLFSDDPREALKDNYTGNSFYLRMELDVVDPGELSQAQWHFQSHSSSEREDSPYGIFLVGRKTQLQPFDVQARFARDGGTTIVHLAGQFQVIDTKATEKPGLPQVIPVAASLAVRVETHIPTTQ